MGASLGQPSTFTASPSISTGSEEAVQVIRLETSRLILRAMEDSDAPTLIRIYRDPVLTHFMGAGPVEEPVELENIARHRDVHYRQRGFGILAWELKETGEVVGRGGFLATDLVGEQFIELSYLLDVRHRKKGLASEAIGELLRWAREELGIDGIVAMIHPDNRDSISVATRCGFTDCGPYVHPEHGEVTRYEIHFDRSPLPSGSPSGVAQSQESLTTGDVSDAG